MFQMTWRLLLALASVVLCGQGNEAELRALFERAEQAQERGDLSAAAGELRKALQAAPHHAEAHARLGMVYRRQGKLAEAAGELERSLRLQPNPRLRALLAFTYADAGRHREAISLLEPNFAAEEKPELRTAVGRRLLESYLATGDSDRALRVAQELRRIAPDDAEVLYLASKVYMNLWNGAYEHLLAQQPEPYQARLIAAEALEAQEKFAEAAAEYRQVLKLSPRLPGIRYRLAQAILRSDAPGEADRKALEELRQELEISPEDARAIVLMGEIHLRENRPDEARRSFDHALSLRPDFVPARVGMAKLLIAGRQWEKALEHLEAARKLAPNDEAVAYNRMLAHRGLGRTEDAKRAMDEFRQLQQSNPRKTARPQ